MTFSCWCPDPDCDHEIEVEAEYLPGEWDGADADGNRGVWREACYVPLDPPSECPKCHRQFDECEIDELVRQLDEAATGEM